MWSAVYKENVLFYLDDTFWQSF